MSYVSPQGHFLGTKFEDAKELSEAVIRRSTNKTMDKRKMTKLQTTIYKPLQRKLTIEQHERH
jgi:hypothetical protein